LLLVAVGLAAAAAVYFKLGVPIGQLFEKEVLRHVPTQTYNLSGSWEVARSDGTGWRAVEVPCLVANWEFPGSALFRKRFYLPEVPEGHKVYVKFYGVKYRSEVYVNGKKVGENWDGFAPFLVDVTGAVKPGGENTLEVRVEDWSSALAPEARGKVRSLDEAYNSVIYPVGSYTWVYGIWDTVELLIVPRVWIYDVFIQTYVRNATIVVSVEVKNEGKIEREVVVVNRVYDGGELVKELPAFTLKAPPRSIANATVQAGWLPEKLWTPDSPHLYTLETSITDADGNLIDRRLTRFGFRDVWVEGDKLYLNGIPVVLRATGTHPWDYAEGLFDKSYARKSLLFLKENNIIAIRYHAQPWPRVWYEAAAEVGVLVVHESAVWCHGTEYKVDDERFWKGFKEHLIAQVRLHRNNPAVVVWSLENELLLTGAGRVPATEQRLAELAKAVKEVDPTRPVMFEGDEDPAGAADIVNLHYPHEYPGWGLRDDYPNTAYWLDKPKLLDVYPREVWFWRRDKPLYIGEYLWMPHQGSYDFPTALVGEGAYADYWPHHWKAKEIAWWFQTWAYRYYRVVGMCPWSTIGDKLWNITREIYRPIAVYVMEYDVRFFGGESVQRTILVFNDMLHESKLNLAWRLVLEGCGVVQRGEEEFAAKPAEVKKLTVELKLPEVEKLTPAYFILELRCGAELVHNVTKVYWIYPRERLDPAQVTLRIGLYDPVGVTKNVFDAIGLKYKLLSNLNDLSGLDVLFIGYHALKGEGDLAEYGDLVLSFVKRGGTLILFEQVALPRWLPAKVSTAPRNSTIAFVTLPPHPILEGVSSQEELRFWRGDHYVSRFDSVKPFHGNVRPIVVSGVGLQYSPLFEVSHGAGKILVCQLLVTEKYGRDPVATLIFHNTIRYYAGTKHTFEAKSTLLVAPERSELREALDALGAVYANVVSALSGVDLGAYGALIIDAEALPRLSDADYARLRDFITAGGYVLVHGVDPSTAPLMEKLGVNIEVKGSGAAPPVLVERTELTAGMSNDVFYWPKRVGNEEEPSTVIASKALAPAYAKGALVRETLPGDFRIDCFYHIRRVDEVSLNTNGRVEFNVYIEKPGTYLISVTARGTQAFGGYPRMEVRVNGSVVETFEVSTESFSVYETVVELGKGKYTVAAAFVNDAYDAATGQDRNLIIAKISVYEVQVVDGGFTPLLKPTVLAVRREGRGVLVIDQVPWPSVLLGRLAGPLDRAMRYASILLTNLGVQISAEKSVALTAASFSERRGGYVVAQGDEVHFYSNGLVADHFDFAKPGRYKLMLMARGTPARGEYPLVEVRVDGRLAATVKLDSADWKVYTAHLDVPEAGRRKVEIAFVNDYYGGGEDRNFFLKLVILSHEG